MSAPPTIELGMRVGPGWPSAAPAHLMRALRRVEVTQQDAAPCGFQLTFLAELVALGSSFEIVGDPLLRDRSTACCCAPPSTGSRRR